MRDLAEINHVNLRPGLVDIAWWGGASRQAGMRAGMRLYAHGQARPKIVAAALDPDSSHSPVRALPFLCGSFMCVPFSAGLAPHHSPDAGIFLRQAW